MTNFTLFETEHFTASQASGYRIPGYVIVETKDASVRVAQLDAEQAADLMQCLVRAEALVQEIVSPERIYVLKFAEENPRVHFHVFPRTARLGDAYGSAVQDEAPYSGARLMDWIWSNHASLGFTDAEIGGFVEAARQVIGQGGSS